MKALSRGLCRPRLGALGAVLLTGWGAESMAAPEATSVTVPEATAASTAAAPPGAASAIAATEPASSPPPCGEEDEADHFGGFVRLTLGLGVGHVEGGHLGPEPGFHPMDDLSHTAPVLGAAFLFGGGAADLALAGELTYERMLSHLERQSEVGFSLYGVGITGTAYSDDEWFVTAHLRWLMMMLWRCDIPCWWDRGDATMGPGVGVTVGKEWFDKNEDDEEAVGIALQGNYASFNGDPQVDYYSGLLLLTLTSF